MKKKAPNHKKQKKPLSLHPLSLDEALEEIMKVPPPKDEKSKKDTVKKKR